MEKDYEITYAPGIRERMSGLDWGKGTVWLCPWNISTKPSTGSTEFKSLWLSVAQQDSRESPLWPGVSWQAGLTAQQIISASLHQFPCVLNTILHPHCFSWSLKSNSVLSLAPSSPNDSPIQLSQLPCHFSTSIQIHSKPIWCEFEGPESQVPVLTSTEMQCLRSVRQCMTHSWKLVIMY